MDADEPHFAPTAARDGIERWLFDLPRYVLARLRASGLSRIANLGEDTLTQPKRFYSFRRASQKGEANYGRQLSAIAVNL